MGIFDDLSKKVSNAGQKTVQKTKDISELARINSLMNQTEAKINGLYCQIGKLYVNFHTENPDKEMVGMIENIYELEQQKLGYSAQIQQIKGVQICPVCGAEVSKNNAFCSSCGAPMPKQEVKQDLADMVRCSNCGNLVKKGMRFCTHCGQSMISVPPVQEVNNKSEESVEPRYCTNCGALLESDSMFCTVCGTKVE